MSLNNEDYVTDILNYYNSHKFDFIYNDRLKILETNDLKLIPVYNYLAKVSFCLRDYEYVIKLTNIINDLVIDDFISNDFIELCMYRLLAFLGTDDLYGALSFINKNEILSGEYKEYREIDGANYTNLLKENKTVQKALVICLFIESLEERERCFKDSGLKYFELLDLLYELGYSSDFIKEMTEIGYILYENKE